MTVEHTAVNFSEWERAKRFYEELLGTLGYRIVYEEEGVLALYSEVSADFEPGVTEPQLAQLLACGLGTGVQMFSSLEAVLARDDAPPPDVPDN